MNTDIRLSITFFDHIRAAGFKSITEKQYAELTDIGWEEAVAKLLKLTSSITTTPTPAPAPFPTPTPKRKYRAEKDQRRSKAVGIVDNPRRGERSCRERVG